MRNRALWLAAALSLCTGCAPSIREAAKLATTGATEAATSPANVQRAETILDSPEVQKAVHDLSAAAASGAAGTAVDSALEEATTIQNERRMSAAAAVLAHAIVTHTLRDLETRPEVQSALSSAAFEVSRQSVLGANEATKELANEKPKQGLIAHLASLFSGSGWVIVVAFAVLVLALVALTIGLFRTRKQVNRLRVERGYARDTHRPPSGAAAAS